MGDERSPSGGGVRWGGGRQRTNDRAHKVEAREGAWCGRTGFAVEGAVEEEDARGVWGGGGDCASDVAEEQDGHKTGVQAADAVDYGLGGVDGGDDLGVGGRADLVAIGVDVPEALDAGGELQLVRLAEVNVLDSEGGKGAWEMRRLFSVVGVGGFVFGFGLEGGGRSRVRRRGVFRWEGSGRGEAGVRDLVLAGDDGAVFEAGGDVVGKVRVYARDHWQRQPCFPQQASDMLPWMLSGTPVMLRNR